MEIFIITHKEYKYLNLPSIYVNLQVGADINGCIKGMNYFDNKEINISSKNNSYNELTGLYWIWKNSDEDIVGICHYRRYFVNVFGKITNVFFGKQYGFLSEKVVNRMLKKHDLIVHNKTFFRSSCKSQYRVTQKYPDDIIILRETLKDLWPDYIPAYDKVMNGKSCHLLNMIIGRKEIVDKYCEWLFSVLFEVERILVDNGEVSFDRRLGMLGERMLDVWLERNRISVKECFTINTERIDRRFVI